ncbi:MAG TPA: HNH endonuclease signature motif containing protein [Candidatus Binatia bacterium]|nr:HNH endonuclease signature motif containing protein [Candidatus Binatia bacterium]
MRVTERDGLPIDVGRRRRMVSARLRRALESRDRFCRFPGRAVPARMTHAHHARNWTAGGRTDLRNLVSLCGFPHRRLHDGVYAIPAHNAGKLRFETAAGRLIGLERATSTSTQSVGRLSKALMGEGPFVTHNRSDLGEAHGQLVADIARRGAHQPRA